MASFNQKIDPTNDPTYLGLAKETDKPLSMPADTKGAAFLEGITKIGNAGINTVDSIFKEGIKDKLREGIDKIQGQEFGVDQATANAASGQPPSAIKGDSSSPLNIMNPEGVPGAGGGGKTAKGAPAGVTKLGETMSDLTDSYNAGKLSQSYYYGKMNALVKQVSQQFPGYKEDVISAATSMLGTNPANALRKALLDDLDANARAKAATASKDEAFIRSNAHDLGAAEGASMYAAYKAGKVAPEVAVQSIIRAQGNKEDLARAKAALDYTKDKEEYQRTNAGRSVGQAMNDKVNNYIKTGMDSTGKNFADLQAEVMNGKPKTEGELKLLAQRHTEIRTKLDADLEKYINDVPVDPKTGKVGQSVVAILGLAKAQEMKNLALSRLDNLSDAVTSDKRGFIKYYSAAAAGEIDKRGFEIVTGGDGNTIKNIAVSKQQGWNDTLNTAFAANPAIFAPHIQAITGALTFKTAAGETKSLKDTVQSFQSHPNLTEAEKSQLTFGLIKTHTAMITAPTATTDQVVQVGRTMFGPQNAGFLNTFRPEDQTAVFARLYANDITQKVKSTGDPVIWNNYQVSATQNFAAVYRGAVTELQTKVVESDLYKLSYDEKNHQYEVSVNPEKAAQVRRYNLSHRLPPDTVPPSVQGPVNRINEALRTVTGVLSADGKDPKKIIVDTLTGMGYNPARAGIKAKVDNKVDLDKLLNK